MWERALARDNTVVVNLAFVSEEDIPTSYQLMPIVPSPIASRTQTKLKANTYGTMQFSVASQFRRRLSVTNLSLENNLPKFRLNAPVVIRVKGL